MTFHTPFRCNTTKISEMKIFLFWDENYKLIETYVGDRPSTFYVTCKLVLKVTAITSVLIDQGHGEGNDSQCKTW